MPVFGPITSARKTRRFGVFDLEWVPGEALPEVVNTEVVVEGFSDRLRIPLPPAKRSTGPLQLRMAGYYDQVPLRGDAEGDDVELVERYQCFTTIKDLVRFMFARENRGNWFFAHAGGLADMQFVLDDILTELKAQVAGPGTRSRAVYGPDGQKREEVMEGAGQCWKIKASFSGSSAIIVNVSQGKNSWHCCDSYWLLRDKLANIGKALGTRKGDDPKALAWMRHRFGREVKDFDSLSRPEKVVFYTEAPVDVLTLYNKIDCEILWKAVAQFEDEIVSLGGQLQQTIASTAMSLFRRAFLQQDIFTSERLNGIAQESYFASRVEVLSRNATDFLIYDINSSFPNAMTFPLPGNLVEYRTTLPESDDDACIYLADATVEVPEMDLPPLPYRKDNRVFFPTGRWRSWFTSTDLRLALREGATLHKVHEVYVFEPFYDFAEYAKKIYKLRAEAKTDFRRLVLKYLLNSLYGKAAESTHKQEMLVNPDVIDRETMQMLQPGVWLAEKEAKIAHRHVVVASVITAIARRTLYDYAKECYRQGHSLYYCDSVTDDRTVVLRDPEGHIHLDPIAEIWGRISGAVPYGEKEACAAPSGWSALARDDQGVEGWFPLKRVIRHKTRKQVFKISNKRGQVEVTQDHSLMVGGSEVKPQDFVDSNMQFDTVKAPPPVVRQDVDLYEYVKHFEHVVREDEIVHRFVPTGDGEWITLSTARDSPLRFKRHYKSGSEDFRRLLRLLGAFVAEGSSSYKGITTETRSMFSLSQVKEEWLAALKEDALAITRGVNFLGPQFDSSSNVYYLRSGTTMMAALFGTLCGMMGSADRHLPSFLYDLSEADFKVFWDKLVEGDGWKDGQTWYTTISQKLAAGLSYLLSQRRTEHSIHYYAPKGSYEIRTRPAGTERKRWTTKVAERTHDGYVYDLEVEGAHTFVDGVGRVLLHNTDSVATRATLPTDNTTLGALKLEKRMEWAEFVAPKIYRGEGFELKRDGTWEPRRLTKAKGFSLGTGQAAWDKLDKVVSGDRLGIQRMTRLRELYRTLVGGEYTTSPFEMLVVKALTFEMLSKRFHYPDGETRAWTVAELRSGDRVAAGFDFEAEVRAGFDPETWAALAAAV